MFRLIEAWKKGRVVCPIKRASDETGNQLLPEQQANLLTDNALGMTAAHTGRKGCTPMSRENMRQGQVAAVIRCRTERAGDTEK